MSRIWGRIRREQTDDVIVVGAGDAGVQAALAAVRVGLCYFAAPTAATW